MFIKHILCAILCAGCLHGCATYRDGSPNYTRTAEIAIFAPLCFVYGVCPNLVDEDE